MSGHVRLAIAAWVATVLGAIVLVPVFSGPFLLVSAFVCAVVAGAGVLLQSWRAPRLLIPVVQLAVLVELIGLLFFRSTLKYGVLPWKRTALAFNDQMVQAMDSINRFSAPLPPDPHLTVFAVSVIAGTGLLIHIVAVQMRQAAWAGLLLLMMYTVPAATVHGGLPALLFVPPAVGYVLLLSAEGRSRLSRWGQRISGVAQLDRTEPIEASALGQAGRRIGLSVIAIATVLPALLPALPEGVLGTGGAGGAGVPGVGTYISSDDMMLDMGRNLRRGDNVEVLRYTGDPTYIRLTALDMFTGRQWVLSPRSEGVKVDGDLSRPPGLTKDLNSVEKKRYRIEVTRYLRSAFAPMPYPASSVSLGNKWRYDPNLLDVSSTSGRIVAGQKYTVVAYDVKPTEAELREAPQNGAPDQFTLDVPTRVPASIRNLAREITAKADGNHYAQAALLQDYFRTTGGFTYSLTTDRSSGLRAIEEFLFTTKTGYCEQYAAAMTLMARILGIPARIGIGFLPGQLEDGKYVVRSHDMHAWPELYFQGTGWVRFEPTPAARVATPPEWSVSTGAPVPGIDVPAPTAPNPTAGSTDSETNPINPDRNLPDETGAAPGVTTGNWWSNGGYRWVIAGVAALVVLSLPWLIRLFVRRKRFLRPRGRASAEGLWAEIRDTARDVGLDWSDTATPRQQGLWLRERLPESAGESAIRLSRGIEAARYAAVDASAIDLRDDAAEVRRALWSSAKATRRVRALLLPPSYRWYLSRGSAEASDLLDNFDLALARLRSALLPRRS